MNKYTGYICLGFVVLLMACITLTLIITMPAYKEGKAAGKTGNSICPYTNQGFDRIKAHAWRDGYNETKCKCEKCGV